jgi:UDP-glucuronate 4-epimerase
MSVILVTGAAGFIGFHLCKKLLAQGHAIVGLDCINDYYDVSLKLARLHILKENKNFAFEKMDLADKVSMQGLFQRYPIKRVVNLAAQAGVRYSIENPDVYVQSNVVGFVNLIECCRHHSIEHLVYASTSSAYGANTKLPFDESQNVDHPMALYAATKRANELIAHSYASLFHLPCTGLRFFTVYGPWGRPDMALFKFAKAILAGVPIDIYNHGKMTRDFTYVDDIVEGVARALQQPAQANPLWDGNHPDPASSYAPYRIYNIGNNQPVPLMDYIHALEAALGKKTEYHFMEMQAGDVPATSADVSRLEHDLGYKPATSVQEGVKHFVEWYLEFYVNKTLL